MISLSKKIHGRPSKLFILLPFFKYMLNINFMGESSFQLVINKTDFSFKRKNLYYISCISQNILIFCNCLSFINPIPVIFKLYIYIFSTWKNFSKTTHQEACWKFVSLVNKIHPFLFLDLLCVYKVRAWRFKTERRR